MTSRSNDREYFAHRNVFHSGHTCPYDTTEECFEALMQRMGDLLESRAIWRTSASELRRVLDRMEDA